MKFFRCSVIHALAALMYGTLSATASAAPLKMALVEVFSGPQASAGLLLRSATRYAVEKINASGGWNGEPIQLIEYDSQNNPAIAADKVKAGIAEGVQIFVQGASSTVAGQLTEDIRKYNLRNPGKEVLYADVTAEAMDLTGDKCHFHHFRFTTQAEIRVKSLVAAMKSANVLGTRVYSINQNYSWGQDMEAAILANAKVGGYEVVEKTLHDVAKIQDFTPYVAKISAAAPDTVISGNWANDLLLLMKATKAAGLKTRFGTTFLDQPGNLANAGETALGHYNVSTFSVEGGGAEGDKLATDYRSKTGHMPVFNEPQTIFGIALIGAALNNVKPENGRLNINTLAKQMEQTRYMMPNGELSFRADDHQIQLPIVVSVVSKDAKYKVDGTDMGFKPIRVLTPEESSTPVQASCKMVRPS